MGQYPTSLKPRQVPEPAPLGKDRSGTAPVAKISRVRDLGSGVYGAKVRALGVSGAMASTLACYGVAYRVSG